MGCCLQGWGRQWWQLGWPTGVACTAGTRAPGMGLEVGGHYVLGTFKTSLHCLLASSVSVENVLPIFLLYFEDNVPFFHGMLFKFLCPAVLLGCSYLIFFYLS